MAGKLRGIEPTAVFGYFEALTQIPRESGNEKAVSDYLVDFGEGLGLEVIQDEVLNVIITKPATAGYENAPHVILQGHMDMVCVKEDDMAFDFETDAIPLVLDGDYIRTAGTTLGADNGIAVAMAMAVLASDQVKHPKVTALFTVAEETGMDGVIGLRSEDISGDILINIDSEEEGTLLASCAGGVNNVVRLPYDRVSVDAFKTYTVKVRGLKGGHSGMEINQGRANAIKVLGRVLDRVKGLEGTHVLSVSGGDKMNAIAKYAEMTLVLESASQVEALESQIAMLDAQVKNEFETADPGLEIVLEPGTEGGGQSVLSLQSTDRLTGILRLIPYGVQTMSANIAGLVESSNNIGVLTMNDEEIVFSSAVRSSVRSLKDEINNRIQYVADLCGAQVELVSDYPEWPYKVDSPIRELMCATWERMYSSVMKVDAIHAGLECGLLKEKVGDIDMISLGPNLYDVHTPKERMSISSVARVYDFLLEVLANIK